MCADEEELRMTAECNRSTAHIKVGGGQGSQEIYVRYNNFWGIFRQLRLACAFLFLAIGMCITSMYFSYRDLDITHPATSAYVDHSSPPAPSVCVHIEHINHWSKVTNFQPSMIHSSRFAVL